MESAVTVRRITRITFKSDETFAVRRWRSNSDVACVLCGSQLGAVTLEEAAWLLRMETPLVHREVEAGRLHLLSVDHGIPQVCLGSVEKAAQLFRPGAKLQINHL
jgi:hypothetical protein